MISEHSLRMITVNIQIRVNHYRSNRYKPSARDVINLNTIKSNSRTMSYQIQIQFFFDGDSGQFENGERFRLADVRSPDKDEVNYMKAKRSVSAMAGRNHRWVTVEEVGIDPYGRLLVKLYNEDGSINDRMRQRGYS